MDSFVALCAQRYIDEIEKQALFNYMAWLREQSLPRGKHSNPDHTCNEKLSRTVIFLEGVWEGTAAQEVGVPSLEEKTVSAHLDAEVTTLYSLADEDERSYVLRTNLNGVTQQY